MAKWEASPQTFHPSKPKKLGAQEGAHWVHGGVDNTPVSLLLRMHNLSQALRHLTPTNPRCVRLIG